MLELETQFKIASEQVQKFKQRPDDDVLLRLYALYKQATKGDVSGKRPGFGDFVGKAKYDAWAKTKGMSKAEAMKQYIELVEKLKSA